MLNHHLSNFGYGNCNCGFGIIILKTLKSSTNFPITFTNKLIYNILQLSFVTIGAFGFGFLVSKKQLSKHHYPKSKTRITATLN